MSFTVKWTGVEPVAAAVYADLSGVTFALNPGVTPSSCTFPCPVDFTGSFAGIGDLSINDGTTEIVFNRCKAVEGRIELSETDRTVPVTIVDRRWEWKYGYVVGTYNQPDGEGNPTSEETARSLAEKCLEALGETIGVTAFVTEVPDDEYPPVKWEYESASKALQEVLESVGCLVALGYDNKVRCHLVTTTGGLPSGNYDKYHQGDRLPDRPEKILIVGSRIVLEEEFTDFEAVGLDTDGDVKLLSELSYGPGGSGVHVDSWDDIVADFISLADDKEKRECARASVYKWFRVRFDLDADTNAEIAEKKLPFLSYRSAVVVEQKPGPSWSKLKHAPPELRGETFSFNGRSFSVSSDTDLIEEGWSLDTKMGIVKFSQNADIPNNDGEAVSGGRTVPTLRLRAAYERNEGDEDDFYVYEYTPSWDGSAADAGNHVVSVPELVLYKIDGVAQNETELNAWALKRAVAEKKKFDPGHDPEGKTYVGLKEISPDGGIMSVEWSCGASGASTTVQLGYEEPSREGLTYKEKLDHVTSWSETGQSKKKRKTTERKEADERAD